MSDNTSKDNPLKDILGLSGNDTKEVVSDITCVPKPPDLKHAFARSALGIKLSYVDWRLKRSTPDWYILDQQKIQINQHDLIPDLAGWQNEELEEEGVIKSVPGWIGEVLSSSARKDDRHFKMPLYAELGVQHFWLVNPNWHTLETFQLENKDWRLITSYKDDETVDATPFGGISFPLGQLWSNE
ncbi:MAG: Uma2 family endonuclease [Gammaproteobacteria bacterium]|nr:Uma2 family endonuclease [Gammaproteobacteria bacterium]